MNGFAKTVTQCDKDSLHLLTPNIIQNIQSELVRPEFIKDYLHLSQHISDPSFHTTFLKSYPDMLPYLIKVTAFLPPSFSPRFSSSSSLSSYTLVWEWLKSNDVLLKECRDEVKQLLTCHSRVCTGRNDNDRILYHYIHVLRMIPLPLHSSSNH